jgi:hypothetical protein
MKRIYNNLTEDSEKIKHFYMEVANLNYHYGEQDSKDTPPTGMVAELPEDTKVFATLKEIYKNSEHYRHYPRLDRAYVNLFAPRELAFYHTDGDCMTLLYYANPMWHPNQGGETKIMNSVDMDVESVAPVPGRIVIFDGRREHTATPFRDMHRFTVALKFLSK